MSAIDAKSTLFQVKGFEYKNVIAFVLRAKFYLLKQIMCPICSPRFTMAPAAAHRFMHRLTVRSGEQYTRCILAVNVNVDNVLPADTEPPTILHPCVYQALRPVSRRHLSIAS